MRRLWISGVLFVGLGLLAMPVGLRGEDKDDGGWRPLFDGKTLDGWRNWKKDSVNPAWKVVDGAMVKGKGGGDLETREEFDYFELILEYKIETKGNSGIMFWVQDEGAEPGWSGPEVQVLDNEGGGDPTKSGWLYGLYRPADDPKTGKPLDATKPAGQWNTVRIVVAPAGETSAVWMNGVKYEEWVFGSDDWKARVAKSKFGPAPLFAKRQKGHIVLQDHGAEVGFRDVRIREWKKER
jgi:hypothetical protein